MDPQKKATVLQIISALWGQPVSTLLELKSGKYYLHVLSLLEQWNKHVELNSDVERLNCIRSFLQEFYGNNVRLEEFFNFDIILNADESSENFKEVELEVAKIAVVLFGIGVLDKNGQHFISSAMQLPSNMHMDVITIIQSVVQAGTTEIALTSNIEKVLREPSAEKSEHTASPAPKLRKSTFLGTAQTSTPKDRRLTAPGNVFFKDSPLKHNTSLLNYSLQDITSPLRGLSIDTSSPSSPLVQFALSPQLMHKATLNQKELEIRKLKQQLNDQIYLKEEMQFTIQDHISKGILKDTEITKLQERIKDLLHLQDAYDELQEMKLKYKDMEMELSKLNKKVFALQNYKEQAHYLEKENSSHSEEMDKLFDELKLLRLESEKNKVHLKTINQLETQIQTLDLQLADLNSAKQEWDKEREAIKGNLEMAKEVNAKLQQDLDELQARQEDNSPGETMGIFLEIQMGELKCQLEEVKQERDALLERLNQVSHTITEQNEEIEELKNSVSHKEQLCLRLTETEAKLNAAESEVENLKTLEDKLCKDLSEKCSNVIELTASVASLVDEKTVIYSDLDAKTDQVKSLLQTVEEKSGLIESLQRSQEQTTNQLKEEISVLLADLQSKELALVEKSSEIDQVKLELQLQVDVTEKQEVLLSTLKTELSEISVALSLKEEEAFKAESRLESDKQVHENEILQLKEELRQCSEGLQAKDLALQERDADLLELRTSLNQQNLAIAEKAILSESLQSEIATLKSDMQKKVEELCQVQELVESLKENNMQKDLTLQERVAEISGLKSDMEQKIKELCQVQETLKDDILQKDLALQEKDAEILEIRTNLDHKTVDNTEKDIVIESLQSEIEALKLDIQQRMKEHCQLQELVETFKDNIMQKDLALQEKNAEILEVRANLDQKTVDDSEKTVVVESLQSEIASLESKLQKKIEELSQSQETLKDVNLQKELALQVKDAEIDALKSEMQQKIEELCLVKETFKDDTLQKNLAIQEKDAELLEVRTCLEQKTVDIAEKDVIIESLQSEIATLESDMQLKIETFEGYTLQKDFALQEKDAELLEVRTCLEQRTVEIAEKDVLIESLQSKITCLKSDTQQKDEENCQVQEIVETLKNDILQKDLALQENIAEILEVKTTLEQKTVEIAEKAVLIESLQSKIASLESDMQLKIETFEDDTLRKDLALQEKHAEILEVRTCLEQKTVDIAEKTVLIESLQSEIVALKSEMQEKTEDSCQAQELLEAMKAENSQALSSLKGQVSSLTELIDSQKADLLEKESDISKLKLELNKEREVSEDKDNLLSSLDNKVTEYAAQCQEQSDEITKLTEIVELHKDKCSQHISSLETELNTKLVEIQKQAEVIKNVSLEKEAISAEFESKQEEIKNLSESVYEKKAEIDRLTCQTSELRVVIQIKDEEMSAKDTIILDKEKAMHEFEFIISQLKSEVLKKSEEIQESEQIISQLKSEVLEKSEDLEKKEANLVDLSSKMDELTITLHQKEVEILHSNELVANLKLENEKKLSQAQEKISTTLEDLNVKAEFLQNKESEIKDLQTALKLQAQEVESKDNLVESLMSEISEIKATLQQRIQEISEKQEVIESLKAEQEVTFATLKDQAASEVNTVKLDLQQQVDDNKKLEELVSHLNDQLLEMSSALQLKTEEAAEALAMLSTLKSDCEIEVSTLGDKLTSVTAKLQDTDDKLTSVTAKLQETEVALLNKESETSELRSNVTQQAEELREKDNEIVSISLKMEELTAELLDKNCKMLEMKANLDKEKEEGIEKDNVIESLRSEIAILKSDLQSKMEEVIHVHEHVESIERENGVELSELRQQKAKLEKELEIERSVSLQKDSELAVLTCSLNQQKDSVTEKEEMIVSLNNKIADYVISLKEKTEESVKATELLEEMKSEKNEENEKLKQLLQTLKEEKETEIALVKEKTGNVLEDLRIQFEAAKESEMKALSQQKAEFDIQLNELHELKAAQTDALEQEVTSWKIKYEKKLQDEIKYLHELEDLRLQQYNEIAIYEEKMAEMASTLQQVKIEEKEYKSKLEYFMVQNSQLETKYRSAVEENTALRDRESKHLKESDSQMKKANEFCNDLRRQIEEYKKKLEDKENESKNFTEISKRQEQHVQNMKETNTRLSNALKIERDTNMKMQKRMEGQASKLGEIQLKYENMQKENKLYATEVNRLKTALDYSDRKLREYQHQLDQAGTALLGDASHFQQIIEEEECDSLEDSIEIKEPVISGRMLRSNSRLSSGGESLYSYPNDTTISSERLNPKRETMASLGELKDKYPSGKLRQTEDRMSICSTSSSQSIKSLNGVPGAFLPNAIMSCANEPEGPDFEWDRLSELQRRNTMYPPHMKSAYPVEMQAVRKDKITDDNLRMSLLPNKRVSPARHTHSKKEKENGTSKQGDQKHDANNTTSKRKVPAKQPSEENYGQSPPKQLRTAPVYQRPGPPTPGKQPRRISGRFTPSHGISPSMNGKIKALGSPIARPNPRHTPNKRTPRRSPRFANQNASPKTISESDRRESVAFNIGFTPMKSSGPKRFLQKTIFGSKSKGSSKVVPAEPAQQEPKHKEPQKNRKPLGIRNFLETGI